MVQVRVFAIPGESYFCLMPLHQRHSLWPRHPPCQTLSHSFPHHLFLVALTTIWDTYSFAAWLPLSKRTKAQLFMKFGFVHSMCPVSRTEPRINRHPKGWSDCLSLRQWTSQALKPRKFDLENYALGWIWSKITYAASPLLPNLQPQVARLTQSENVK